MRRAGPDALSLALIDARNHTLGLFTEFQHALQAQDMRITPAACVNPPLWELGHVGWFQEWWIARNLQRSQGMRCDPEHTRLASIEPQADRWWDSGRVPHQSRFTLDLPSVEESKKYLLDTLESTLELLEKAPDLAAADNDDRLYFYRLCLFHEDMHGEALAYTAQTLGLSLSPALRLAFSPKPLAMRAPLMVPATKWQLGSKGDAGFVFDNERGLHTVEVPEFEIDAQTVTWSQYVEFVADGGYDHKALWHPQGWQWLQALEAGEGRRAPRYVEEIGVSSGAVLQNRFGQPMRLAGNQSAMHMSWWEADAWCRWAGRRLPSEVEWELAAHTAANRGFRWGEVWEWTGTTFQRYPGFTADPYRDYSQPWFGSHKVLRGASFATRARMKDPKYRNFFLPERDDIFCGFRSCSL